MYAQRIVGSRILRDRTRRRSRAGRRRGAAPRPAPRRRGRRRDRCRGERQVNARNLFHRVAVFSDAPDSIHDPRHPQPQTGADKMFAPIGLVWTNHPQPDQGTAARSDLHMGTAFLVSPCYVLTAYHVVFGYRFRAPEGRARRGGAGRFRDPLAWAARGSRAVRQSMVSSRGLPGRDWTLLRLEPDAGHRCLGEDPISAGSGWLLYRPL